MYETYSLIYCNAPLTGNVWNSALETSSLSVLFRNKKIPKETDERKKLRLERDKNEAGYSILHCKSLRTVLGVKTNPRRGDLLEGLTYLCIYSYTWLRFFTVKGYKAKTAEEKKGI